MTLVLKRSFGGAGTHALVIGAGVYEWGSRKYSAIEGSAQSMAVWLASRYRNKTAELASLEVLMDRAVGGDLEYVPGFTNQYTSRASHQAVEAATTAWMKRADSHEGNVALFYFAGEGFDLCPDTVLKFYDFKPYRPPESQRGATPFLSIAAAMRACRARRQLYLLDVDRAEQWVEPPAEPLMRIVPPSSPPPVQAVIYSASAGQRAFHDVGDQRWEAPFVDSLIQVLDAGGSDLSGGPILVQRLAADVAAEMARRTTALGIDQAVESEFTGDFDFHDPLRVKPGSGLSSLSASSPLEPPAEASAEQPAPKPGQPQRPPAWEEKGKRHGRSGGHRRHLWQKPRWIAAKGDDLAVEVVGGLIVASVIALAALLLSLT
jgi:hypothetical protein